MLSTILVANETLGQFEITYNSWSDTVDGKHIYHQVTKVKRAAVQCPFPYNIYPRHRVITEFERGIFIARAKEKKFLSPQASVENVQGTRQLVAASMRTVD